MDEGIKCEGRENLITLAKSCLIEARKLNDLLYEFVRTPECEKEPQKPQNLNVLNGIAELMLDCRTEIRQAQDNILRNIIEPIGKSS